MTNRSSGRGGRPQAIVGPITLSIVRVGSSLDVPQNSAVGPSALSSVLGATQIVLIDATSTQTGITVRVSCDGSPETIEIAGAGSDNETVAFAEGVELFAIARTTDQIILQSEGAEGSSSVTFPIGTGTVTLTASTKREI